MNPNRKGQAGNPVSTGMQSSTVTPFANTHFILPYGLRLQQKVGMSTITNVVDAGATVVYTANNNYSAGNIVSIYDVSPVSYNLKNATILSATSTTFTITSSATGTYVSGGVAQRTGAIDVTVPAGITFVYAICVGGGGETNAAGGVAWGWTLVNPTCIIGQGYGFGSPGGYTRYGNIIAGAGGSVNLGAGGSGQSSQAGATNYYGVPGGAAGTATSINGLMGAGGGAGYGGSNAVSLGGNGGNGISGGGGGMASASGSQTNIGGNGGSGLVGGGGGLAYQTTGNRTSGNGGTGINILTGQKTLGGLGVTSFNSAAGGGGGIASNGINATPNNGGAGGLGGGGGGGGSGNSGVSGAGILYLFY